MQGKIIKGIAGFYYVYAEGLGELECRAKGVFRSRNEKPLVGDNVEVSVLDEEKRIGNITAILERKNSLIRPASANVDQAVVIFAAAEPEPNLNLLDRFLVMMERERIETIICFNKKDLAGDEKTERMCAVYRPAGYPVYGISLKKEEGLLEMKSLLDGKTTILAGPSGVGKSTFTNYIDPEAEMETGAVSLKIKRGKHTTRHTELFHIGPNTFLLDTPGFSSLYLPDMEKEELKEYFPEFSELSERCRFGGGCVHIGEPGCAVKDAYGQGSIAKERYENYRLLYEELKNKKRY